MRRTANDMPYVTATRFGPYEIVSPVGVGGMGEVYRARDTRLNRAVALKVLAPSVAVDPDLRARFQREAHAVAALSHPHICAIYDVGEHDGVSFLVMELLEGRTLADQLQLGPLPLIQALTVAEQIADALDEAHTRGIVHRDLARRPVGRVSLERDRRAECLPALVSRRHRQAAGVAGGRATTDVARRRAGALLPRP